MRLKHQAYRAMVMRLPARLLPGWQCSTRSVDVETPLLRLAASHEDAMPAAVLPLVGRLCREVTTAGDGACALHAVFGTPEVTTNQVRLRNAWGFLRNILGEVLPQVRREMQPLVDLR